MVIRGRMSLRVSLGGGDTDVALFCEEQGGAAIGSTINKYAYCSIVPREDDQIVVHSLDFDMTMKYNIREDYVYDGRLDLVAAVLSAMDTDQGCKVYLQCGTPPGSGLGVSSTVMVAILTTMTRWKGVMMDAYALADPAYQVKCLDLGTDGGYQDQYAATFGGFNLIELHGRNSMVINSLRTKKDITHELQYNFPLCYAGRIHASASIIKDQVQSYEKEDAFEAVCKVRVLTYALKDELLRGNLHSFSKLLDHGQQNKKHVSSKVTNPWVGQLYGEALKTSALGGKLPRAGGGGYLFMYCPYNVRHKVVAHTEQAGGQLTDRNFELRGAQSWVVDESKWQYDQVKVHMPNGEYRLSTQC